MFTSSPIVMIFRLVFFIAAIYMICDMVIENTVEIWPRIKSSKSFEEKIREAWHLTWTTALFLFAVDFGYIFFSRIIGLLLRHLFETDIEFTSWHEFRMATYLFALIGCCAVLSTVLTLKRFNRKRASQI